MKKLKKEDSSVDSTLKGNKQDTWSSCTEKDGVTERITVEKLSNVGYLVTLNKYGKKNDKEGYFDYTKKLYSENNPLDPDDDESPIDQLFKTLSIKK
jgi:hypothetical protein